MKSEILDLKNNKTEELTLNKEIFEVAMNKEALNHYLRVYAFNQRQGTSKVKKRGEVAGSGIKPWAQKGTGRARVGDKRTPLWRHGGIVHGPVPKDWGLDLNKKSKKLALSIALSDKNKSKVLFIVKSLESLTGKTKDAIELMKKLKLDRRVLFIDDKISQEMSRSLNNIARVDAADVDRLNAFQVVGANSIIITKKAVEVLEKRLEIKKK